MCVGFVMRAKVKMLSKRQSKRKKFVHNGVQPSL